MVNHFLPGLRCLRIDMEHLSPEHEVSCCHGYAIVIISTMIMCFNISYACVLRHFSRVWLFATPWTVALQAPLSMGFSRQEYWSGLPCPLPGDLPNPGIEPRFPALQSDSLHHQGSPRIVEWIAYPFCTGSSQLRNWTGVFCIAAGGFFTSWAIREAPKERQRTLKWFIMH